MRLSDAHWSLVTARATRAAAAAITALETHKVQYVTGGGWAVWAHEPSTPSVDYDAFLSNGFPPNVVADLARQGFQIGPRREIEALELDAPSELLGSGDPDLGETPLSFVPARIFRNELERKRLRVGDAMLETTVPTAPALAVTKLAALRGRSIGYAMHEDAAVLALLDRSTANMMRTLPQSYYYRKAGKDLFDVSLLLSSPERVETCRRIADSEGVWKGLVERLPATPALLLRLARDMAARVGRPDPAFVLRLGRGA